MFGVGPFAYIGPNLGHNRLGKRIAHTVYRHEINSGNPEDMRTRVHLRGILPVGVGFASWWRGGRSKLGHLIRRLETGLDDGEDPLSSAHRMR